MRMKLRIWRLRRGMTQEELAKAAGLSRQAILRIEGRGVIPHPATLAKLAKALNVSAEELLVEDEDCLLVQVG